MTGKRWFIVFVAAMLFATYALAESVQDAVARSFSLLQVQGRKSGAVLYRGDGLPTAMAEGMRLAVGDRVATDRKATAFFLADQDRLFQLDPLGSVALTSASAERMRLELQAGTLYFNIGSPLKENESLEVDAGGITMSIRGTRGVISWINGVFTVMLDHGEVTIQIGEETYTLKAGQRLVATQKPDGKGFDVVVEEMSDANKAFARFMRWCDQALCGCGELHPRLSCGHYECSPGGPHITICMQCGRYKCNSRKHGVCKYCKAPYDCVGTHGNGICTKATSEYTGPYVRDYLEYSGNNAMEVIITIQPEVPREIPEEPGFRCDACNQGVYSANEHYCSYCGGLVCVSGHTSTSCPYY